MARWITSSLVGVLSAVALACATTSGGPVPNPPPPPGEDEADGPTASPEDREHRVCRMRIDRGLEQLRAGRGEQAERTLRDAVREDRGCVAAYLNLAVLLRQRGDLAGALLELRRALAVDAQDIHALHQMVLVHLARAEQDASALELAELTCRQGLMVTEDWAPLHNTCGIVDVERGRVVEALARFERAFTLDPGLLEAWMNFGQVTLSFRGYADAERAFRRAIEIDSEEYDAHIGLGIALRGLGRVDEANRQYRRAIAVSPSRPEAYYNLGILSQEHREGSLEDLERAGELFETFVDRAGDDADYRQQVADVQRCCPQGMQRGRGSTECRPGRLQIIRQSVRALGGEAPTGC